MDINTIILFIEAFFKVETVVIVKFIIIISMTINSIIRFIEKIYDVRIKREELRKMIIENDANIKAKEKENNEDTEDA